jgi:hypothetical protein
VPSGDIQQVFSGMQKGGSSFVITMSILLITIVLQLAELSLSNKSYMLILKFDLPASNMVHSMGYIEANADHPSPEGPSINSWRCLHVGQQRL